MYDSAVCLVPSWPELQHPTHHVCRLFSRSAFFSAPKPLVQTLLQPQCCKPFSEIGLVASQVAQASREAADPGDEITALVSSMGTDSTGVTTFKEGDRVLVVEGDLKNMDGVVASVNEEGKLMVKSSLAELANNELLPIEPHHVIKFFQVGCPLSLWTLECWHFMESRCIAHFCHFWARLEISLVAGISFRALHSSCFSLYCSITSMLLLSVGLMPNFITVKLSLC